MSNAEFKAKPVYYWIENGELRSGHKTGTVNIYIEAHNSAMSQREILARTLGIRVDLIDDIDNGTYLLMSGGFNVIPEHQVFNTKEDAVQDHCRQLLGAES